MEHLLRDKDGNHMETLEATLHSIADGGAFEVVGESWNEVFCGNYVIRAGGWEIVIFNDCDSFDYVDAATTPSGKEFEFEDFAALGIWPGQRCCDELQRAFEENPDGRTEAQ